MGFASIEIVDGQFLFPLAVCIRVLIPSTFVAIPCRGLAPLAIRMREDAAAQAIRAVCPPHVAEVRVSDRDGVAIPLGPAILSTRFRWLSLAFATAWSCVMGQFTYASS
jgi:hypothetical protein